MLYLFADALSENVGRPQATRKWRPQVIGIAKTDSKNGASLLLRQVNGA
jgi:hypothetical protein